MRFPRRKKAQSVEETSGAVNEDSPPEVEVTESEQLDEKSDEISEEELASTEPSTPTGSSPQTEKKNRSFMSRFKREKNGEKKKETLKRRKEKNERGIPKDAEKIETLDGGYAFITVRSKLEFE